MLYLLVLWSNIAILDGHFSSFDHDFTNDSSQISHPGY